MTNKIKIPNDQQINLDELVDLHKAIPRRLFNDGHGFYNDWEQDHLGASERIIIPNAKTMGTPKILSLSTIFDKNLDSEPYCLNSARLGLPRDGRNQYYNLCENELRFVLGRDYPYSTSPKHVKNFILEAISNSYPDFNAYMLDDATEEIGNRFLVAVQYYQISDEDYNKLRFTKKELDKMWGWK